MPLDAVVNFGANTTQLEAGAKRAEKTVAGMSSRLSKSLQGMGQAMTGAIAAFVGARGISGAIEGFNRIEGASQSLRVVMKDASATAYEIQRLNDAAQLPGLSFETLISGSARLQAIGLSALEARKLLVELGNMASLSGLTAYDFKEIVDAISDIGSAGDITDEKIDRLTERSAILSRVLKDTFGASTAKGIREAGVSADDFLTKLSDGLATLERASKETIPELAKGFKQEIAEMSNALLQELSPAIKEILSTTTYVIQGFKVIGSEIQRIIEKHGGGLYAVLAHGVEGSEALEITQNLERNLQQLAEDDKKAAEDWLRAQDERQKAAREMAKAVADEVEVAQKEAPKAAATEEKKEGRRKIKGYSQAMRAASRWASPFRGLDSFAEMKEFRAPWEELHESESAWQRLQNSPSPFEALKGRGAIAAQAAANNTESKLDPKNPSEETLKKMEQHLGKLAEAVD